MRFLRILSLIFAVTTFCPTDIFPGSIIPFSLPWDDGAINAPSVLTLENRDTPAGENGFIRIENGRFVDGAGKRIRFLGINLSFSGNYPTHLQAVELAKRMAKFGINCVRFHHTDTDWAPRGIWKTGASDKQTLDPDNLDRMDYLINELKKNGIYADINLKIGREVVTGDGFTDVDRLPTYDKGPDHYFPRMIELQKNYARDLLTHKNPYTGNRYVDEPAVAIVEINNESGLVNKWAGRDLDDIPQTYIQPLQNDWNAFLKDKYQSTEALRDAWAPKTVGSEEEMLTDGLSGWRFQQVDLGKGSMNVAPEGPNGEDALKVNVESVGEESWHVQIHYTNFPVKKGGYYKISLQIRAEPSRTVNIGMKMNHDPWSNLHDYASVGATPEWKTIELAFSPSQDEDNARLDITGLGNQTGALWIANPSAIESSPEGLPAGQSLDEANVAWLPRSEYSQNALPIRSDWIDFLVARESEYYRDMSDFLKNELGLKALIGGTQLGFGTALSQMENDFIDIHGYWNHPTFPNRSWDSVDWYVNNVSILPAENNTIERLMMSRIEGMPFTCTEYNHPAPITYSSECVPLLAAYAAFQDWDGIFFYSYSHSNDYRSRSINNFFDIIGHTPKMLAMPAAFNMLVRGDVSPAKQTLSAVMSPTEYKQVLTERSGSLWFNPLQSLGISGTAPYQHKTTTRFDNNPESHINPDFKPSRRNMQSDTGELIWNQLPETQASLLIRTKKTKGFVGFIDGRTFELGDGVSLEIGETVQDWANVLLTYLGSNESGHRWLLTATGYHENQGMVWKNEEKNSVGNRWGDGPPLVETVPCKLTISPSTDNEFISSNGAKVYSLNNLAFPEAESPQSVSVSDGQLTIDLSNPSSLWYEIVFEKNASIKNQLQY